MKRCRTVVLFLAAALAWSAVPTPKEHFGFTPGDDYQLAGYTQLIAYFQKLERSSDRIKLRQFGQTSLGKPMYAAFISSAGNLAKIETYRKLNAQLALGEGDEAAARRAARDSKVFVWIDSGLHASEVAPSQQAPDLAYRMITDESDETRRIRENAILIQIPCINPDGLDWIVHWYRQNTGTPYELAPLPWPYQKYAGHDNNRDWYMFNLPETRAVSKLLFTEWFPEIVYNQHQAPPFPSRIFIPPYAEPLNPNIPAAVMEGINQIGSAMGERFARENKSGVISYWGYDAWWNGGLRSVPAFHNMHGILTETAGFFYATPKVYRQAELPDRFGNGNPTRQPTIFYERPWQGGKWTLRDAIEYMLTADWAILDLASSRKDEFLFKAWAMARAALDPKQRPYAYVVPADQWDPYSAQQMLDRLELAGIRMSSAGADFEANGKTYRAGSAIIPAQQPFRPYLIDLMEPQHYPELKMGTTGPTKRPYDIAGWTLPYQMGVQADRVEQPFTTALTPRRAIPSREMDHRNNASFLATAGLLKNGTRAGWTAEGSIVTGPGQVTWELRVPRTAVYEPWTANIDAGWTEWVFDNFNVPYKAIHNEDIRKGGLRAQFDSIVLASQSLNSILHGLRAGVSSGTRGDSAGAHNIQRPEYSGGIEIEGLAALDGFVREGGTLIALDQATELPVQEFPIGVRALLRPPAEGREAEVAANAFYCPGSLLRITVDTTNPIAFGMPRDAVAFSSGGQAFDIALLPEFNKGDREVRSIARYATSNLLASGWVSGERQVLGKSILAEARYGQGKVVLFGFRPQHRGQSWGTFKFLLNAVYLASARQL